MSYQISKEHVWVGAIPDHPDALAEKLRLLSQAGLNLELILARRDIPGRALLFVAPLRSVEEMLAAEEIGLAQEDDVRAVRVLGPDKAGIGAQIATALAAADLNIRAYSASVIGKKHITFLAFDSERDADDAVKVLKETLNQIYFTTPAPGAERRVAPREAERIIRSWLAPRRPATRGRPRRRSACPLRPPAAFQSRGGSSTAKPTGRFSRG